jgi:hypothetical protein
VGKQLWRGWFFLLLWLLLATVVGTVYVVEAP